jgi:hypothetical protein
MKTEDLQCGWMDTGYLLKDGTLFLLCGRNDFEKRTSKKYEYPQKAADFCAGRWQIINLSLSHIRAATTSVIIQPPICLFSSGILPEWGHLISM